MGSRPLDSVPVTAGVPRAAGTLERAGVLGAQAPQDSGHSGTAGVPREQALSLRHLRPGTAGALGRPREAAACARDADFERFGAG